MADSQRPELGSPARQTNREVPQGDLVLQVTLAQSTPQKEVGPQREELVAQFGAFEFSG
ncbi:MAG: hypothetical protein P8I74_06575 [Phycisphaerales bacterium]|nr:hypothetical protein [Phycisphaerales bacterium]